MSEQLLTSRQVADLLALRTGTLETWRRLGIGPKFIKIRRAVRYWSTTVQEFIQRGEMANVAQALRQEARRLVDCHSQETKVDEQQEASVQAVCN